MTDNCHYKNTDLANPNLIEGSRQLANMAQNNEIENLHDRLLLDYQNMTRADFTKLVQGAVCESNKILETDYQAPSLYQTMGNDGRGQNFHSRTDYVTIEYPGKYFGNATRGMFGNSQNIFDRGLKTSQKMAENIALSATMAPTLGPALRSVDRLTEPSETHYIDFGPIELQKPQ